MYKQWGDVLFIGKCLEITYLLLNKSFLAFIIWMTLISQSFCLLTIKQQTFCFTINIDNIFMIKRRDCWFISILAVRKVGHLNIKTKMFDFEARVLIGWLANTLASQPIRTHASMSNTFIFMLRWPIFLTASTVNKNFVRLKSFYF